MKEETDITVVDERKEYVKSLREFANFLENSEAPLPQLFAFNIGFSDKEKLIEAKSKVPGVLTKLFTDYTFELFKKIGIFTYCLYTSRNSVCERIVVGKKIVPSAYYPEHEEDIVEYKCPEHVLGEDGEFPTIIKEKIENEGIPF